MNSSYSTLLSTEFNRFLTAIDQSIEALLPEDKEDVEKFMRSAAMLKDRLNIIYNLCFKDKDNFLTLYEISDNTYIDGLRLQEKKPEQRSMVDAYSGSIRTVIRNFQNSYLIKNGFSLFGLGGLRKRILVVAAAASEFIKYFNTLAKWIEIYLSWTKFGSELACQYYNANRDEDESPVEPSDFYNDYTIKLYAILKTSETDSEILANILTDIDSFIEHLSWLIGLTARFTASLKVKDIDTVINAISNSKPRTKTKDEMKDEFSELREFCKYIRDRAIEYSAKEGGTIHTYQLLISDAKDRYITSFIDEISKLLSLFPNTDEQERFIRNFEKGKLWQQND